MSLIYNWYVINIWFRSFWPLNFVKILTTHRRWQVYKGDSKDLLFSAKKSGVVQLKTELDVFLASNTKEDTHDFKVKGSFKERSCTVYTRENTIIAQVRLIAWCIFVINLRKRMFFCKWRIYWRFFLNSRCISNSALKAKFWGKIRFQWRCTLRWISDL